MATRKSLGKGLSALLGEEKSVEGLQDIPINRIDPNPSQTRFYFDKDKLEELATSLKEVGFIEPIVVSLRGDRYELIAGERRFRAAGMAGFKTIPAIIKNVSSLEALEMMVVENIQREDLTPIEEAISYDLLLKKRDLTHDALAKLVGKSRSHITNSLRILQLPEKIRDLVAKGKISAGQAKILVGMDAKDQDKMVREILEGGVSVRDVERKAAAQREKKTSSAKVSRETKSDTDFKDLEKRLRDHLQTKVTVKKTKGLGGKIEVEFFGSEDLEGLLSKLKLPEN
jgi:ParB family chromosome partitioning protein